MILRDVVCQVGYQKHLVGDHHYLEYQLDGSYTTGMTVCSPVFSFNNMFDEYWWCGIVVPLLDSCGARETRLVINLNSEKSCAPCGSLWQAFVTQRSARILGARHQFPVIAFSITPGCDGRSSDTSLLIISSTNSADQDSERVECCGRVEMTRPLTLPHSSPIPTSDACCEPLPFTVIGSRSSNPIMSNWTSSGSRLSVSRRTSCPVSRKRGIVINLTD